MYFVCLLPFARFFLFRFFIALLCQFDSFFLWFYTHQSLVVAVVVLVVGHFGRNTVKWIICDARACLALVRCSSFSGFVFILFIINSILISFWHCLLSTPVPNDVVCETPMSTMMKPQLQLQQHVLPFSCSCTHSHSLSFLCSFIFWLYYIVCEYAQYWFIIKV